MTTSSQSIFHSTLPTARCCRGSSHSRFRKENVRATSSSSLPQGLQCPSVRSQAVKAIYSEDRMSRPTVVFALFFLAVAMMPPLSHAQAVGTGFPVFNSFAKHDIDIINEGNLNVHLEIPIFSKSGRGLPINYVISYDTLNWYPVLSPTNNVYYWTWPGTGWHVASQPIAGYVTYDEISYPHACNGAGLVQRTNYTYYDQSGGTHLFSGAVTTEADCNGVSHGGGGSSGDDYSLFVDDTLAITITAGDGKLIHPLQIVRNTVAGGSNANPVLPGMITDSNGNQMNNLAQEDTLGVPALQLNCTGIFQCNTVTYPSPTNPSTFVGATFYYTQMTIQSNFQCGYYEGSSGSQLLTSIKLPDTSLYHFTYEQTPGYPAGNTTGRIASVTLPSGAQITYQYTGSNNGIICADGSVAGLTRTTPDGQWTYTRTVTQQLSPPSYVTSSVTTLIDPMGNKQVINFGKGDSAEAMRQIYTGSATLAKTIETCYNGATFPCTTSYPPSGTASEKAVREEIPDSSGKVSEVDTFYAGNVNGVPLPSDVWEYDFGSAAPGPLLRHTKTIYAALTTNIFYDPNNPGTSYPTPILNRPASVTVYDGSGNTMAQTTYAYDETTPTPTSGTPSHVAVTGSRGNPTTITQLVQGTTTIHTTKTYYDTGTLSTTVDPNGNPPTTYTYGTGSCGNAFPTKVTNAAGFNTLFTWDCNGGVMTGTTDANIQLTSYSWTDPNYWRLTQITYPDGGQKTATYNTATTPWTMVQSTKISGTLNLTTKTIYDSQARVSQQQLTSDPEGTTYTDKTYDGDGRVKSASNPYRSTSDSTYGITSYVYDGLGRVTSVTEPDGSVVGTSYSANQTTVTDEAGKQRQTQVDGLGRLTAVWEAPNTSGYNFETDYQYDSLGNLICAVQKGTDMNPFTKCASAPSTWRPRSFAYDSLSRLTSATNPESGTITYVYDFNSNLLTRVAPKEGQTGTALTTHNYTYDVLNRLVKESHLNPNGETEEYAYDGVALTAGCGQSPPTITSTNAIGRRSAMCGTRSGSGWSFDPMGRPLLESTRNLGSTQKVLNVNYTYNLDGSLKTLTYPSGDVVTYTVGAAGRTTQVADSTYNFVTAASYAPPGLLTGMTNGSGIVTSNAYNDRLQPFMLSAGVSGQAAIFSLCYDFHLHVAISNATCGSLPAYTTGDNGNVFQVLDKFDPTRSTAYIYDSLNRIAQAYTVNTTSTNCWGETYSPTATATGVLPSTPGIDPWGNLINRSGVSGMGGCPTEGLSATATTNNQLNGVGMTYDAAGNVTKDNLGNTPTYDAEDRIATVAGFTYYYDADGTRMEKSTGSSGTMYWMGPSGALTETDLTGTINEEYVYFNGARIARVDRPSGNAHYYFSNNVGSHTVVTNANGVCEQDIDYFPYGGVITDHCPVVAQHYKFAGKERDSESGLDYFGARHNGSTMGRFMTPDPLQIMKQKLVDPQQWNMYAYVRNNPLRFVDPTGAYLVNCAQGDKKCNKAADNFEKQRQKDLNSKDRKVSDAAAAWGDRGTDNNINVTFKPQAQVDADAGNTDTSHKRVDAFVTPGARQGQPDINAEFSESLGGKDLQRTIAHEGSHLEDELAFIHSWDPWNGRYEGGLNPTHFSTEFQAFEAGASVESYGMFPKGPKGYQKLEDYIYRAYPNADDLVFPPSVFPQ
jgi:RHS repeat-associated protein